MKHNLKRKYKWKKRDLHFLMKDQLPKTSIWGDMSNKSFTNPNDSLDHLAESALEGNDGTTNPSIIVNKPQRFTINEN